MSVTETRAVPMVDLTFRAQWASFAIKENLGAIEKDAPQVPTEDGTRLLPAKNTEYIGEGEDAPLRVGIVGAGVAGLFTAMIFDQLKQQFGLNVEYEILEADDRVGGRLFSYYFNSTNPEYPVGPHDYYDVGAMRFPDSKIMKRTFQLFETLGMTKVPKENRSPEVSKGSLVPYYFSGIGQPSLFNGIQVITREKGQKVTANDFKITGIPADKANDDANELVERTIKPFRDIYNEEGPQKFWKMVVDEADDFSVREYMKIVKKYDYNTIEFLECMTSGSRWYDQAFSETILESMDFDAKADWWCVEGGAAQIARRMHKHLQQPNAVQLNKAVRAISYVDVNRKRVEVTVAGEAKTRVYDAVFNSAPLGAMQQMQLEGLKLNWGTKQAIRSLGYSASCKVGVRFKNLWWIKEGITDAGQGRTDLPIGTCVYPSYNIHDNVDEPGVLLVSYTWSQQAERFGALIDRQSPANEQQLKEVLIHDLARLHAKTGDEADYQRLHKIISDAYLTHHAYNWYANPRTAGAFAFFGPAQFRNMYQWITRTDGKHIIIGEAASAHHAWVVGSLESAVRGVYQFLHRHGKHNRAAWMAARAYESDAADPETSQDQIQGPFGPLPAEFSWTDDIKTPEAAHLDAQDDKFAAPGCLARLQVLFETIRLKDPEPKDRIDHSTITRATANDRLVLGDLAKTEAVAA